MTTETNRIWANIAFATAARADGVTALLASADVPAGVMFGTMPDAFATTLANTGTADWTWSVGSATVALRVALRGGYATARVVVHADDLPPGYATLLGALITAVGQIGICVENIG